MKTSGCLICKTSRGGGKIIEWYDSQLYDGMHFFHLSCYEAYEARIKNKRGDPYFFEYLTRNKLEVKESKTDF